jgi:hypothetical protein
MSKTRINNYENVLLSRLLNNATMQQGRNTDKPIVLATRSRSMNRQDD